jgi:hypothetical protein
MLDINGRLLGVTNLRIRLALSKMLDNIVTTHKRSRFNVIVIATQSEFQIFSF